MLLYIINELKPHSEIFLVCFKQGFCSSGGWISRNVAGWQPDGRAQRMQEFLHPSASGPTESVPSCDADRKSLQSHKLAAPLLLRQTVKSMSGEDHVTPRMCSENH